MSTENLSTHQEQGENQEHVDAMIAKGEQIEQNNNPDQEQRPEWLPDKFKDAQQMAEAYAQLEQKMGSGEEATQEEVEAPTEEAEGENPSAETVQQAVTDAGVDFNALQGEYNEQGGLSDATYDTLAEAGFSKDLVTSWIKGQEALNSSYESAVYESAGGKEEYAAMTQWASDNLSKAEIAAYDKSVDSGDIEMVKLAITGLRSKYQSVEGSDPSLIGGQSTTSTGGNYSSWAEVTAAMKDTRYETDPAYRQQVANKLARSNVT